MNMDVSFLEKGNERWYQLKRTGKLIERATKFNGWTAWGRAGVSQIAAKHLLMTNSTRNA